MRAPQSDEIQAAVEIPARAQMRQRDPGVLRVPHNRRNRAKNEHPDQQIHAGTFEFPSEPGTSASTINTEINSNAFVYLQRNPSPSADP